MSGLPILARGREDFEFGMGNIKVRFCMAKNQSIFMIREYYSKMRLNEIVGLLNRKAVISMLTLQEQVMQKVSGLSEENLQFLLEMINRFMQSDVTEDRATVISKRIGIAKGKNLYDEDYDFDEMNPEIAKLFGVME